MASVILRDVSPRDGLQALPGPVVPTETKLALVHGLAATGLRRIEAGSFVSARAVPQMADSGDVFRRVERGAATLEALVMNERGARAAVGARADVLVAVVAASDTFSRRNTRMSRSHALAALELVAGIAHESGTPLSVDIATAFGCAYEGPVDPGTVTHVAEVAAGAGAGEITLADTTGMATPGDITRMIDSVRRAVGESVTIGLHLHNTRGAGLVNVWAGLTAGVRHFDASVGGLGGCPFAPGATGNICTEDLVHLLEAEGFHTGVDLDALVDVARTLQLALPPETLMPGQVMRAGPRHRLLHAAG